MNVTVTVREPGKLLAPGAVLEVIVEGSKTLEKDTIRNAVEGVVALGMSRTEIARSLDDLAAEIPEVALQRLGVLEDWLSADGGPMFADPAEVYGNLRTFFVDMRAILGMSDDDEFSGDAPLLQAVANRTADAMGKLRSERDEGAEPTTDA